MFNANGKKTSAAKLSLPRKCLVHPTTSDCHCLTEVPVVSCFRLGLMSHFGALAAAASGRSPFMLYPGVGIAAGTTANALDKHWYSAWSQPLSAAIRSPTGKSGRFERPCSLSDPQQPAVPDQLYFRNRPECKKCVL